MSIQKLAAALNAVDWNANVKQFLNDQKSTQEIATANIRIATWAKQFEIVDRENPALCFVRGIQTGVHHVATSSALALYRPAAAAMREMLESALYYTYYRTHPTELATSVRSLDFYMSKAELLEFHKIHTPNFADLQTRLGLVQRLNAWYKYTSSIIHGHNPGAWVDHNSLASIKYSKTTLSVMTNTYCEGVELIHRLFLCTAGRTLWQFFSPTAKRLLAKGIDGETKAALGIDSA